jgi:hypothetical protein
LNFPPYSSILCRGLVLRYNELLLLQQKAKQLWVKAGFN